MTSTAIEEKTLLEFLIELLTNDEAREAFQQDPHGALEAAGLGDVSVEEVKDLLPLVLHHVDPECVAHYEENCDEPDCYEAPTAWCEPEQEGCHYPSVDYHQSNVESVITHITYVSNHYSTVNNVTIFENETNIWSGGGDVYFDQDIDFTSANLGDGAVFVGGDNNGTLTHGDDNLTLHGDGNQVAGQGSTAAFGAGSAYSGDIEARDGGAISFGAGDATATQENVDESVNDSNNDNSHDNPTFVDSHDDNSVVTDASTNDSGNTIDSGNTDSSTNDSGNDNSDNSTNDTHDHADNSQHVEIPVL